jgi:hypothetical protein
LFLEPFGFERASLRALCEKDFFLGTFGFERTNASALCERNSFFETFGFKGGKLPDFGRRLSVALFSGEGFRLHYILNNERSRFES